jgi:hypothetical protein
MDLERVPLYYVLLWRGKDTMPRLIILVASPRSYTAVELIARSHKWYPLSRKLRIDRAWPFLGLGIDFVFMGIFVQGMV